MWLRLWLVINGLNYVKFMVFFFLVKQGIGRMVFFSWDSDLMVMKPGDFSDFTDLTIMEKWWFSAAKTMIYWDFAGDFTKPSLGDKRFKSAKIRRENIVSSSWENHAYIYNWDITGIWWWFHCCILHVQWWNKQINEGNLTMGFINQWHVWIFMAKCWLNHQLNGSSPGISLGTWVKMSNQTWLGWGDRKLLRLSRIVFLRIFQGEADQWKHQMGIQHWKIPWRASSSFWFNHGLHGSFHDQNEVNEECLLFS